MESESYEGFAKVAGTREGETVVVTYVEWPDKAVRDADVQKFTSDPRMQFLDLPLTFDGLRLIAGGFLPMLTQENEN